MESTLQFALLLKAWTIFLFDQKVRWNYKGTHCAFQVVIIKNR